MSPLKDDPLSTNPPFLTAKKEIYLALASMVPTWAELPPSHGAPKTFLNFQQLLGFYNSQRSKVA
jgi:hypothetical protein